MKISSVPNSYNRTESRTESYWRFSTDLRCKINKPRDWFSRQSARDLTLIWQTRHPFPVMALLHYFLSWSGMIEHSKRLKLYKQLDPITAQQWGKQKQKHFFSIRIQHRRYFHDDVPSGGYNHEVVFVFALRKLRGGSRGGVEGVATPLFSSIRFLLFCLILPKLIIFFFLRSCFTSTIRLLVKWWKDNVHFATAVQDITCDKVVSGSNITGNMNRCGIHSK